MTTILRTNPIKEYLDKLRVRTFTEAGSVMDVTEILKASGDMCSAGSKIFRDLLNVEKNFDDDLYARTCVGYLIKRLFRSGFYIEGEIKDLVLDSCFDAQIFVDSPEWSFLKAESDDSDDDRVSYKVVEVKQQVVEGIDTKVVVKANGKIKKGGKKLLCIEMYKIHVIDATEPMKHSDFVKLLVKELDLTQQGANTYGYNLKSGLWT